MGLNVSAIIPTLEAAATLAATLESISTAEEIIVVDGGSTDDTQAMSKRFGARVIEAARGRGSQLATGAEQARCEWLLFLHADTVLDSTWVTDTACFTSDPRSLNKAAAFRFALDDSSWQAKCLERIVSWRRVCLGFHTVIKVC